METKTIRQTGIKGDLEFDGIIKFAPNVGRIEIEGHVRAEMGIKIGDGTDIFSDGNISSGRDISSGGNISSGGDISSGGYISSGRYISSGGDISFNYYIQLKNHLTCALLRIFRYEQLEQSFWSEKFALFGFRKISQTIKTSCLSKIRPIIIKQKKRVLECRYWTKIERAAIISLIEGRLENYKLQ